MTSISCGISRDDGTVSGHVSVASKRVTSAEIVAWALCYLPVGTDQQVVRRRWDRFRRSDLDIPDNSLSKVVTESKTVDQGSPKFFGGGSTSTKNLNLLKMWWMSKRLCRRTWFFVTMRHMKLVRFSKCVVPIIISNDFNQVASSQIEDLGGPGNRAAPWRPLQ